MNDTNTANKNDHTANNDHTPRASRFRSGFIRGFGPSSLFGDKSQQNASYLQNVARKECTKKDPTIMPTLSVLHPPVSYPSAHWIMQRAGYGFVNGLVLGSIVGFANGWRSNPKLVAHDSSLKFSIRMNQIVAQMGKQSFRYAQAFCLISPAFPFVYRWSEYWLDRISVPTASSVAFAGSVGLFSVYPLGLRGSVGGLTLLAYGIHIYLQRKIVHSVDDPVTFQTHQNTIYHSHFSVEEGKKQISFGKWLSNKWPFTIFKSSNSKN